MRRVQTRREEAVKNQELSYLPEPPDLEISRPLGAVIIPFRKKMRQLAIFLAAAIFLAVPSSAQTPIVNCPSGFNSNTSGACSVTVAPASGSQQIVERTTKASVTVSGGVWQFVPAEIGHASVNGQYYQTVPITPGFISTSAWTLNGQNFAMTVQNANNSPPIDSTYTGIGFSAGASCEGGFYQGGIDLSTSPNNTWALQLGSNEQAPTYTSYFAGIGTPSGFLGTNVQMFVSNEDPCLPFLGSNPPEVIDFSTARISTYPVQMQIHASFTGVIAGTTLTASSVTGTIQVNSPLLGTGIATGTYISSLGTGTGGAGTYTISRSQSIGSEAMQASGAQFSANGHTIVSTVVYTGTHVTLEEYDQTAGGSCPGTSCFTYTWPEIIQNTVGT